LYKLLNQTVKEVIRRSNADTILIYGNNFCWIHLAIRPTSKDVLTYFVLLKANTYY